MIKDFAFSLSPDLIYLDYSYVNKIYFQLMIDDLYFDYGLLFSRPLTDYEAIYELEIFLSDRVNKNFFDEINTELNLNLDWEMLNRTKYRRNGDLLHEYTKIDSMEYIDNSVLSITLTK